MSTNTIAALSNESVLLLARLDAQSRILELALETANTQKEIAKVLQQVQALKLVSERLGQYVDVARQPEQTNEFHYGNNQRVKTLFVASTVAPQNGEQPANVKGFSKN